MSQGRGIRNFPSRAILHGSPYSRLSHRAGRSHSWPECSERGEFPTERASPETPSPRAQGRLSSSRAARPTCAPPAPRPLCLAQSHMASLLVPPGRALGLRLLHAIIFGSTRETPSGSLPRLRITRRTGTLGRPPHSRTRPDLRRYLENRSLRSRNRTGQSFRDWPSNSFII
jgi:hypothetical protein